MNTLQLTIPARFDKAARGLKIKPREISQWLDDLPYLDALRAARAAREQLRLLNRQPIAAAQRLDILAAFQHSYRRLRASVGAAGADELLSVHKHIAQELAFGYKICVHDLVNKRLALGQRKLLAPAICGALDNIGRHMTHYFSAYQQIPRALWCESVMLFRFSQRRQLDRQACRLADGRLLSPARVFLTMALLRAADPYRLPPGFAWGLRRYLGRQVEQGCLEGGAEDEGRPLPLPIESRFDGCEGTDAPPLQVDVSRLVRCLEADVGKLEGKADPAALGFDGQPAAGVAQVLARLARTWREPPERKAERSDAHQRIELTAGLDAAWYVLNGKRAFEPALYHRPDQDSEIDLAVIPLRHSAVEQRTFPIVRCNSLDRSSGGLAVQFPGEGEAPPQVGQLAALHRAGGGGGWVVAVCRWLIEQDGGRHHTLGLQYLAREARAVVLRVSDPSVAGDTFQPAIAAGQKRGSQRLQTLIAHAGTYTAERPLTLFDHGIKQSIVCTQLLEATPVFERFVYEDAAEE